MKDISLHILDIVQNSISAKASLIEVIVEESRIENIYKICIKDNGTGMPEDMIHQVTDPYVTSRKTRKVGLGLPLLKQNAEMAGGGMKITSQLGIGTMVCAVFEYSHLDRVPAGDLPGSYILLVTSNPTLDFVFTNISENGTYTFDTREVKEVLGDIPISELSVNKYLREMVAENLKEIGADFSF